MACRALSQRNNDPTKASRPWDTVSLLIYLLLSKKKFSFSFFIFYFSRNNMPNFLFVMRISKLTEIIFIFS